MWELTFLNCGRLGYGTAIVLYMVTNISEEPTASKFRVPEQHNINDLYYPFCSRYNGLRSTSNKNCVIPTEEANSDVLFQLA
jgi:hypothetical protein